MSKKKPAKPQTTFLSEHMSRLKDSILAQAQRARAGSTHSGIKGSAIEVVLRRLLQQYLPGAFSVGTGQFANSTGALSPQIDVLVYDGAVFPRLAVNEDDSVIVCCEAVLAAIECKCTWAAHDVATHFKAFRQVDNVRSDWWATQRHLSAAYYVFVMDSIASPDVNELKDAERAVGVYPLAGDRCSHSPFGQSEFTETPGNSLEFFLKHVLADCMRKGPGKAGLSEFSYGAVARYFGWYNPAGIDET